MDTFSSALADPRCQFGNFVDLLQDRAQNQPEQIAYIFLDRGETPTHTITYRQLDERARGLASQLQQFNAAGERALLLYPPGLEFIVAFLGCLYAGVVAVPAYPPRNHQNATRLQAIATSAQAAIGLTTTAFMPSIAGWLAQEPHLATMRWLPTDEATDSTNWQPPQLTPDTLAFLQYTSGSTGMPKGVMVSQGNLMHNSAAIQRCFAHTPQSRGVIWLPPYHDMGLIGGILQPLYVGFLTVLMAPVDFLQKPIRWLQAISNYRATTSGGPNFAYDLCLSKIKPEQLEQLDLSSWDLAFTGAEPVRAATIEQFTTTFAACGFRRAAFYPCYGMAETTLIAAGGVKSAAPVLHSITALPSAELGADPGRYLVGCGQSLPDQPIAIVDPNTLHACPDNQVGEIWVAGPSVAQGYWQQPEATSLAFQAYRADGAGPFLRTGDLGLIDQGELFITGRMKDVIIIRGQNHYPQDIELTVETSHAALRAGCGAAFSVEINGTERLVIVHEVERRYLRQLNCSEVVGDIRQQVAADHDLQVYAAILVKTGSIPKTSSGKIRRHACKAEFLANRLNVVEDWSENPRYKAEFMHLQTEVAAVFEQITVGKQP